MRRTNPSGFETTKRAAVDPVIAAAWKARQEVHKPKTYTPAQVTVKIGGVELEPGWLDGGTNPRGLLVEILRKGNFSIADLATRMGVRQSTVRGMITRLCQKGRTIQKTILSGVVLYGIKGAA